MNHDPIDALTDFYDACRRAAPPNFDGPASRHALLVPALGIAVGLAAALGVALIPATPRPDARQRTIEAIAFRRQPPDIPSANLGLNAAHSKRKAWRT
ncbi:MAG: hypothetical protein ACYC96_02805 [Fimbriimonadaceae bacterium]